MKRFGIVGMGLLGFSVMAGLFEGEPAAAAPAAVAEPVAAPAKPPVAPKGTEDIKPAKDEAAILDEAGYAQVEGDPGLNYAMKFLAGNGFNADSPAVEAAFNGDFSLLKAELAQKGISGWEQAVGLAEQSYARHVEGREASQAEVGQIVTDFAESQGVDWEQAVAHVAGSASAEEKTAINSLLADPATAHIAASYITSAFINNGSTEIEPAARATGDNAKPSNTGGGGAPLSRREYTAEMAKLRTSMGDGYLDSPAAQALYRRLSV